MLKNTSPTTKLFLLILCFFGLIFGIGIIGLREIKSMRNNSDKMYDEVVHPIVELNNVRFAYLYGVRTTVQQLRTNDISYRESLRQLIRTQNIIEKEWNAYINTSHTKEESSIIDETQLFINETNLKIETIKLIINLNDKEALNDFALKNLNNAVKGTVDKLTALIDYQENLGDQYKSKNTEVYTSSLTNLILTLFISTIIILILGFLIIRDIRALISSLKKSNIDLQHNEIKYRSVFENAGDGLFLVGSDKLIKEVNAFGASITGYSYQELLSMNPNDLHSEEDLKKNPFDWERLSKGLPVVRQRKMKKKDGSTIDIEMNTTLVGENEVLSVVRDITERIQAEKAKITSDQKFGVAIESSLDTIIITNYPSGEFVEVNPSFTELFGYTLEEAIGKKSIDLNLHLDLATRIEIYNEIAEYGYSKNKEVIFQNKKGEKLNCLVTSNVFKIDDDAYLYTVVRDITEQKKSEIELANLDKKITELIDSTNAVIWESDAETFTLTYINPVVEKLFGYTQEEWYTPLFWKNHIYLDDRVSTAEYYYENAKNANGHTLQYRFVKKDGEILWVQDIVNIIEENGKPKWIRGIMTDITASKHAEIELAALDKKINDLIESTEAVIWEADAETFNFTYINSVAEKIFGYPTKDWFEPDFWKNHIHKEDRDISVQYCYEQTQISAAHTFEYRFTKSNGELLWVRDIVNVFEEDGKPRWLRGVIIDITAYKNAEIALKESNSRLELATTSANIGVFDIDYQKELLTFDDICFQIFGFTREEHPNPYQIVLDSVHPDDRETVRINGPFSSKVSTEYHSIYRIIRQNGDVRILETTARIIRDKDGVASKMIGVQKDITEAKEAEQYLKDVSSRLQLATTSANIGIFELDFEQSKLIWDDTCYRIFGVNQAECTNAYESSFKVLHPEDLKRLQAYTLPAAEEGNDYMNSFRIIWPNGEVRYIESSALIHRDVNGNPIRLTGVNRDITEAKEAEQKLTDLTARLQLATTSAQIGIFDLDITKTALIWDDTSYEIFGVKKEEGIDAYQASVNAIHPKDRNEVMAYRLAQLEKGDDYNYTFRILWPNNEVRYIESNALIMRNEEGQAIRMIGVNRDITSSKIAEKEMKNLTRRLQLAITSQDIGIFDWDLNIGELHWDETTFKIHGVSPENCEDTKEALVSITHEEDRESTIEFIINAIKNESEFNYVYRIVLPNKEIRYIESNSIILRNEQTGRATRMIGVNKDITKQIETQQQLENMNVLLEEKVAIRTEDLELANKKINDSINYAQNIQRAILSKSDDCYKLFPNSFVLWKPKDVVSGDFMWSYSNDQYKFMAVIDCTGHGVPGAFLSIVAKQLMDKIVKADKIEDPEEILNKLDRAIISTLKQENRVLNDGMDVALCRIDQKNDYVVFAGAQRPLFYFDGNTIIEISGSKYGIGGGVLSENSQKYFNQMEIKYTPGQAIYLTSDGYYSQFGGAKGKKLMKSRFTSYLFDIANKPIQEQGSLLNQHLMDWQGKEEQVDDILVIGIQL